MGGREHTTRAAFDKIRGDDSRYMHGASMECIQRNFIARWDSLSAIHTIGDAFACLACIV